MTRFLRRVTLSCLTMVLIPSSARTQDIPQVVRSRETTATDSKPIPIWPGIAPGSENWTQQETQFSGLDGKRMIRNVVRPTLTVYAPDPDQSTGAAVIVCPGGGVRFLSWQNEGTDIAEWLQKRGVTAFVLKYRLKETPASEAEFTKDTLSFLATLVKFRDRDMTSDVAETLAKDMRSSGATGIADGLQAVKVVRQSAKKWKIQPDQIGMMGFSAGAIITSAACVAEDPECRPDFAAPIYGPVFGEIKVKEDAPPLFILCASDDSLAEASSVRLYSAWRNAGREAELHIYEKGGHGFGMAKKNLPVDGWMYRFGDWLKQRNFINP